MTIYPTSSKLALGLLLISSTAATFSATAFDGAKVCEKVKSCVLETMQGQDMPQSAKDAILAQLDSQCLDGYKAEEQKLIDAGLEDEATACADDMLKLTCPELMNPNQANQIESCQTFEKKRIEAGLADPDE